LKLDPRDCNMKSQNRDANGFEYRWGFQSRNIQEEGNKLKEYDFFSYQLKMTFVHCEDRDFPVDKKNF
jgi:hypothetical protein